MKNPSGDFSLDGRRKNLICKLAKPLLAPVLVPPIDKHVIEPLTVTVNELIDLLIS